MNTITWNQWTITVTMLTIDTWRYIASREQDYAAGIVYAWTRTGAQNAVIDLLTAAEG